MTGYIAIGRFRVHVSTLIVMLLVASFFLLVLDNGAMRSGRRTTTGFPFEHTYYYNKYRAANYVTIAVNAIVVALAAAAFGYCNEKLVRFAGGMPFLAAGGTGMMLAVARIAEEPRRTDSWVLLVFSLATVALGFFTDRRPEAQPPRD